jgi:branched-chain amino acid transport system ATP-binding protein
LLTVSELRAGYGKAQILHGVSITIERGAITALLGANGAGKTTLLRTIAGLVPATGGAIELHGRAITRQRSSERVEQGIALIPEGRLLFPSMSVAENLRLGAVTRRARSGAAERMREMYVLFPRLAERSSQAASTLSGGEQQMLAIARGLMSRPELLLLDEPTWGLAPIMCETIFETITRLCRDGLTVLLAEQNIARALELATRGYVVENGRIAVEGAASALLDDPRVKSAYLGR